LSHAAAAEANMTGSAIFDIDAVSSALSIADLTRVSAYINSYMWAIRHFITHVLRECIPGSFDSSRIRTIFENEASFDRYCARCIREESASRDATADVKVNPNAIAFSDPRIGPRALTILLECLSYDFDPLQDLTTKISSCTFSVKNGNLSFDGLPQLLASTDAMAKLPAATIASLDLLRLQSPCPTPTPSTPALLHIRVPRRPP